IRDRSSAFVPATMPTIALLPSCRFAFFFYSCCFHPDLHSFPTRRSSDLAPAAAAPPASGAPAAVGGARRARREASSQGRGEESRSEEHTSELQSRENLVCRLLLEKKNLITSSEVIATLY